MVRDTLDVNDRNKNSCFEMLVFVNDPDEKVENYLLSNVTCTTQQMMSNMVLSIAATNM